MDFAGVNTNFTIPGTGQATPFTPGGVSPFTPGGFDPLANTGKSSLLTSSDGGSFVTDFDRKIWNSITGGGDTTPGSDPGIVASAIKGVFGDADLGSYFARFGLEIIGLIFIVFGFLMLAMRGGESLASSEIGRTAAKIAASAV